MPQVPSLPDLPEVPLSGRNAMPALGLGTWAMGEDRSRRKSEIEAVRHAIALGYRLFDTAEMYGEGGAEEMLGEALGDAIRAGDVAREDIFVVSKVYPHHASRKGTLAACERSRKRLGLDRIDLYLLHWRGDYPLAETVAALRSLVEDGRIGSWGVSNFDVDDMQELEAVTSDGEGAMSCACNQVHYSPSTRGVEYDLLPWMRERAMPLMAYSPIDQGMLANDATLRGIGARMGASAAQVALAWMLRQSGVVSIPKAVKPIHLEQNFRAAGIELGVEDIAALERRYPAPRRKQRLSVR